MISKEEVQKIAGLARLELSEKEIEKMQKDLSSILDYFNILKKAPKPKDKSQSSKDAWNKNVLRKDTVIEKSASLANNLVEMAPDKKDGYIKVRSIL